MYKVARTDTIGKGYGKMLTNRYAQGLLLHR